MHSSSPPLSDHPFFLGRRVKPARPSPPVVLSQDLMLAGDDVAHRGRKRPTPSSSATPSASTASSPSPPLPLPLLPPLGTPDVCFLITASFMPVVDRVRFACVSRYYHRLVLNSKELWRVVDLRCYRIERRQFAQLMSRIGCFIHTLHLLAQGELVVTSSRAIDGGYHIERRHAAVQWLLENGPLMSRLKVLSVMSKLDWAAIQQFIMLYGLTALTCANPGVPPDMPATVTVRDGAQDVMQAFAFNGLVADPTVAGGWVSASLCASAGRIGKRCEEVPSFPWRRTTCNWCHATTCRHCRPVDHRTCVLPPAGRGQTVDLWLCAACERHGFDQPPGFRSGWGATLLLKH